MPKGRCNGSSVSLIIDEEQGGKQGADQMERRQLVPAACLERWHVRAFARPRWSEASAIPPSSCSCDNWLTGRAAGRPVSISALI
ncbi:hypothetical protein JZ751_003332 [Albula glossodonta]|uniref:Uncharacterized protein n=1 Tax=Albula glossodonta TaxID=121402 RepID=A0A8T2N803_9TELE|nr:hypothetical protein JZ751_003332 [Albula glossodonta]